MYNLYLNITNLQISYLQVNINFWHTWHILSGRILDNILLMLQLFVVLSFWLTLNNHLLLIYIYNLFDRKIRQLFITFYYRTSINKLSLFITVHVHLSRFVSNRYITEICNLQIEFSDRKNGNDCLVPIIGDLCCVLLSKSF